MEKKSPMRIERAKCKRDTMILTFKAGISMNSSTSASRTTHHRQPDGTIATQHHPHSSSGPYSPSDTHYAPHCYLDTP